MINIKALLISITTMIVLGLVFELIFLFIDIGYNMLMKSYPVIKAMRQPFYYLFVFVGLFFIMFTGGYLVAIYAKKYVAAHSVVAAVSICGIALYSTSSSYEFTFLSLIFIVLSIGFSLYGNFIFKKNDLNESAP